MKQILLLNTLTVPFSGSSAKPVPKDRKERSKFFPLLFNSIALPYILVAFTLVARSLLSRDDSVAVRTLALVREWR